MKKTPLKGMNKKNLSKKDFENPQKQIVLALNDCGEFTTEGNDFEDLNRRYLLIARELCRADLDTAEQMLGIPARLGEYIQELTISQIENLAMNNMLLFSLRFRDSKIWDSVIQNVSPTTADLAGELLTALSIERVRP